MGKILTMKRGEFDMQKAFYSGYTFVKAFRQWKGRTFDMQKVFYCLGYEFVKEDTKPFVKAFRRWKGETFANRWLGRKLLSDEAFAQKVKPIVKKVLARSKPELDEARREKICSRFGHDFIRAIVTSIPQPEDMSSAGVAIMQILDKKVKKVSKLAHLEPKERGNIA